MSKQHWQDRLVGLIGVWLILSYWVLDYMNTSGIPVATSSVVFWNSLLTGIAAMILAFAALASFRLWEEWADIALGAWLVVSPWLLGFADIQVAVWNVVLCGLLVVLSAIWTLYDEWEPGRA